MALLQSSAQSALVCSKAGSASVATSDSGAQDSFPENPLVFREECPTNLTAPFVQGQQLTLAAS
jgi:hypothetical protein